MEIALGTGIRTQVSTTQQVPLALLVLIYFCTVLILAVDMNRAFFFFFFFPYHS